MRAQVPVPWRLRLRAWWARRRLSPAERRLAEQHARALDEAFLFGKGSP